jgi:wyosine [tRNA(Phe)-imidazoG37] synthetase (radical SAM superfamily)
MANSGTYVFGPVASRRLGRSLGVDLVPPKTCTMDCLYCQAGRTTSRTLDRREWVPAEAVLAQAEARVVEARPDVVTFSGSGEPTLHSRIGEILRGMKSFFSGPLCVITNSSLLTDPGLRDELAVSDRVLPSLDAGDEETFARLNRPAEGLRFADLMEGLDAFRRNYPGTLHLEVFLVPGINDQGEALNRLAAAARRIAPDRIELNTAARHAPDSGVRAVPRERLEEIRPLFGEGAVVIADSRERTPRRPAQAGEGEVVELLRRRPCTEADLVAGLGLAEGEIARILDRLNALGRVGWYSREGRKIYRIP